MDLKNYAIYPRQTIRTSIPDGKIIYINKKSNLMYLISQCIEALERTSDSVVFFAMGIQINKACLLIGELQERYGSTLDFDIYTKTETMIDDLVPYVDDEDLDTRERIKSVMVFRVYRRTDFITK